MQHSDSGAGHRAIHYTSITLKDIVDILLKGKKSIYNTVNIVWIHSHETKLKSGRYEHTYHG